MKLRVAVAALAFGILTILPAMSVQPAVNYGTIATPQADQQLKAMENKFFEHDFSKEPEEYRLQRLEKFAFGQTNTGTVDVRLARLSKVIDMHKSLVAQKPQLAPTDTPPVAPARQTQYSRQLDDPTATAQSAHDKMKWVEDYRPRPASAYSQPMRSVVPDEDRMRDEERDLEEALQGPLKAPNDIPRLTKDLPVPTSLSQLTQTYDPSVFGDIPPDHHARMLTRVAWCEQHVFGHTFPELHLPARLHQLSAEVLPNDHSTDFELMDRLDLIVREVVMQQHPPIAYGK